MKKVLLASTALVLSAGVAAADVSVGGDGRMGVIDAYDGFGLTPTDAGFTSRIRISFSASGETDGGLSFGGSVRADNAGNGAGGTAGSVFVEGSFGKISMGDVDGAARAAVGHVSGVGLTGLADRNESLYIANAGSDPSALYEYSTGDIAFYLSSGNPSATSVDAMAVGVSYGMGDITVALGYEKADNVAVGFAGVPLGVAVGSSDHIIAGVSAAFGDATVKVNYGTADLGTGGVDFDQYALSLDYVIGATTVTAFYNHMAIPGLDFDAYGVGMAHDLGGGASLKAGYSNSELSGGGSVSDDAFDFGISMSF